MKNLLLTGIALLSLSAMAQEMTSPLIIPQLYAWRLTPNGKWLAGDTSGVCDVYGVDNKTFTTYTGAKGTTITNDGVLVPTGARKPSLIVNGEVVEVKGLEGAKSGSIQLISASGNRICGNINYPEAGVNGLFVCDLDENGVAGIPKPLKRPTLDFFGYKPQFSNVLAITDDGSTIVGFVQDWRGYYCYPILYRENENGEWDFSYPTASLFNPEKYELPYNPWPEEPYYPEFTDFMHPIEREAYENALADYYMGLKPDLPDVKDYMTPEEWQDYYDAAVKYNEWWYGNQEAIIAYDKEYNQILNSSVIFALNDVAISPDGKYLGLSYLEYPPGREEVLGIMRVDTSNLEFQKYETEVEELYPTQVLSDGSILMSQPYIYTPGAYIVAAGESEIIDMRDYFRQYHPDYLAWIDENLNNTGTIYTNDDLTIFSGSVLAVDCDKTEEITGGYYSFTYLFSPELAGVESIYDDLINHYIVYSLNGYKILETENIEEIKKLPEGIYVINGKTVKL